MLWTRTLLVLVATLALASCQCQRSRPHRNPEPLYGELHTVAFGGDTVLARRMNHFVEMSGAERPLAGVRQILSEADLAVVNLECIIASGGEPTDKGENNPYYYRGRPELIQVLTKAGVDVASLANNHAGDYGPEAVAEGGELLRKAGISPVGAGRNVSEAMAPVFHKVDDTVIAFIAMDMTQRKVGATATRGGPHFVWEERPHAVVERVREQVAAARRYAHLVFFVTHWGRNYDEEPSSEHRNLARRLVREANIDALLGTSAHQFQGMEVVDGRPIIYDAGDLLFDFNSNGLTHKTALFVLHFDQRGVRWVEAIPVRMGWGTATVATGDDQREILDRLDDLSQRLGTKLFMTDDRALMEVWNVRPRPTPSETWEPPQRPSPQVPTATSYRPPQVVVDELPDSATKRQVQFEGGIELLGYEMPSKVTRGRGVRITTYWRATEPQSTSYQIFTHVDPRDPPHRPHWRGDHQPGDWSYPTTRWRPGEIVRDSHQIRPPRRSRLGPHEVFVGLFESPDGRRASGRADVIDDSEHDGHERVRLGLITVAR